MIGIRILLVDDDPDLRDLVDISLSLDPELAIKLCASGADALVIAAEWLPTLILLDVMMPNMDGPTTFANLRKKLETAHIPILFLTASARSREIEHFISLGALGVMSKPFNPMTLATSVRNYLRQSEVQLAL